MTKAHTYKHRSIVSIIIGVAIATMSSPANTIAGEAAQLAANLGTTASQSAALLPVTPPVEGPGEVTPKSGINYVLYSNSMEVIPENTGVRMVDDKINTIQTLATDRLVMQESGFLEVFANNDANTPVYYDNMTVTHTPGRVLEINTYYPYGMIIPELSAKAALKDEQNWYKFSAKELQKELNLNVYDFGNRIQDPMVGRFWTPDRFAEKYYHLSPYSYAGNNPINYIDINGDSIWLFKPDGSYLMTADDGKATHSGLYMQDSKRVKNEDGSYTRTYSNGYAFEFNDPDVDTRGIKNGFINKIEFVSDEMLQSAMEESGVLNPDNGLFYAKRESKLGKMDYGMNSDFKKNTFYITQGTAYNVADFGNYLWGMGMNKLGIPLWISRSGAHWNNATGGRDDYIKKYNFGPDTYGSPGIFDSPADQRAIVRGYYRGYNR